MVTRALYLVEVTYYHALLGWLICCSKITAWVASRMLLRNQYSMCSAQCLINLNTFTATTEPAKDGPSLEIRETSLKISGEKESVQQAVPFTNADTPYNE
jgi:hypothetical protein